MIQVNSCVKTADNSGGTWMKCITIFKGFKRRYAYFSEMVGVVAQYTKAYTKTKNRIIKERLQKKVKFKRKIKAKKKRQAGIRPYLALLVAAKKKFLRPHGEGLKFDENRLLVYTEPTKFGPAGKTENIPNPVGTKVFGPTCIEVTRNEVIRNRFLSILYRPGAAIV